MKKTAIYIRVSSDKQANEGDSLSAQRDALIKYINGRPDLILSGEYMDDGVSGTKVSRDELTHLLEDVKSDKIDLILFTKLDRWFRSVRHYTATQEILDKHDVKWTAIWEPIYDTTSPQGRLIVNQMMSIAQFEAEHTGQRIRQVQKYKISQGEVISGSTPPGYSIVDKHLVPNGDAENVRTAFEEYSRTGSLNGTMRRVVGLSGLPRSKPAFKKMLRNTIYIGKHPYGNDEFCTPIIDEPLFYDVQRQITINVKSSQKYDYVFSGLIHCAECGGAFGANTRKRQRGNGKIEIIHQYRCYRHFNYKPPLCDNPKVINESVLERYLINNLSTFVHEIVIKYSQESRRVRDYTDQITALQRKIDKLKELYINELISIEEYKADREKYTQEITDLQRERPPENTGAVERLQNMIAGVDLGTLYYEMTQTERRRFWRGILKGIQITKDRQIDLSFLE